MCRDKCDREKIAKIQCKGYEKENEWCTEGKTQGYGYRVTGVEPVTEEKKKETSKNKVSWIAISGKMRD